jgi:cutinase
MTTVQVVFGDPDKDQPINGVAESKVATFCATGDTICDGTAIITAAHLSYAVDVGQATSFVKAHM